MALHTNRGFRFVILASIDCTSTYLTEGLGNVSEAVTHVKQVRKQGMGVISMKLVGEGTFTTREDRQAAIMSLLGCF
jgi:hypothetical protein